MLLFATSDKGGTGRSVTGCNVAYRRALQGSDVCYLDFDFASPTAGAIFAIDSIARGTPHGGLHSYLLGHGSEPDRRDVWSESDRPSLRERAPGTGRLVLLAGDVDSGEFPTSDDVVTWCAALLSRLDEEFDLCVVDLSAGRAYATEIVLAATAREALRAVTTRWLIFHRWTRQHIIAAAGLLYEASGLLDTGARYGHDRERLIDSVRFVRTAVVDPDAAELSGLRATQVAWLRDCNRNLQQLASRVRAGRGVVLETVPLDPLLQWREQLISDDDVWARHIANPATVYAFDSLAKRITDDTAWESL